MHLTSRTASDFCGARGRHGGSPFLLCAWTSVIELKALLPAVWRVLPHRSFFCKDDSAREAHAGEQYTFDANGAVIEALSPWQVLAWLLMGLKRYWASGRTEFQAPASCREWAGSLVHAQEFELAQPVIQGSTVAECRHQLQMWHYHISE